MVMHRVRATSYVRRTLSQPLNKRRVTAALTPLPDGTGVAPAADIQDPGGKYNAAAVDAACCMHNAACIFPFWALRYTLHA